MTIYQAGQINPTALTVPGVYTQIVQPPATVINGVPTNVLGIVGTASWGPKNAPVIGSPAQMPAALGPMQTRKYDMGTAILAASWQGANNIVGVRATDGTDTAAAATITAGGSTALTLTGKYTGSLGNGSRSTGPGVDRFRHGAGRSPIRASSVERGRRTVRGQGCPSDNPSFQDRPRGCRGYRGRS